MNLNDRLYERLTPKERFNIALSASARNDRQEIERIKKTCPVRSYRMYDAEFVNMITNITDLLGVFAAMFNDYLTDFLFAKVHYFETQSDWPDESQHSVEVETQFQVALTVQFCALSKLKSIYESFYVFCKENEIDFNFLVEVHGASLKIKLDVMISCIEHCERDEETYVMASAVWVHIWTKGRNPSMMK